MSVHVLVEELSRSVAHGGPGRRGDLLRRIADLFVGESAHLADAHVAIFDEVMCALARDAEPSARSDVAERLAGLPIGPPRLLRDLAFDESIAVAGPLLRHCALIEVADLVEIATSRGPDHRAALAARESVPAVVRAALQPSTTPAAPPVTAEPPHPSEAELAALIASGSKSEVQALLARMADLPLETVARGFRVPENDPLIILCKSIGLGWPTFRGLLDLKSGRNQSPKSLETTKSAFEQLAVPTAQRVLRFVTAREKLSA